MVVTKILKDNIKASALAEFDNMSHIGFGTGVTTPTDLDTALTTPIIRKTFDETPIKNTGLGTYEFSTILGLTEANGNTLAETGLFDAETGGTMSLKKLLNNTVSKTESVELSIGLKVTVNVS